MYTKDDLKNIIKEAQNAGAQSILTTEKDAVKLSIFIEEVNPQIDIFALKLGIDLDLDKLFEGVAV